MRLSAFFVKLIPVMTTFIGSLIFFYIVQVMVQTHVSPLQKKTATISLPPSWIKVKDLPLPTIKFNASTLGGEGVTDLGNSLYKYSQYILPVGVLISTFFSIVFTLGLELRAWAEQRVSSRRRK